MKLRTLAAAAALGACACTWAQTPKYIFYYIGDGMGMGPVMAAETYRRTVLRSDTPLTMMQMPVASWAMTYSVTGTVTDSAAAGTALSTGTKTRNYMLGMNPDTTAVYSITTDLSRMGYGIGIVTSVAADDATPGAFYAHVPNRSMFYEIGTHMAESGFEFFAGAGLRGTKTDGKDNGLLKRITDSGMQIVRGPKGPDSIASKRVLLIGDDESRRSNIGYTIDSIPGALNLPAMTEACLDFLSKNTGRPFFMMVEGGNIDHALHANDGGAAVKEILNFDSALKIAFDFYRAHPDETLIVVTADHDTGGMVLLKPTSGSEGIANIDLQKVSKEAFSNYCKSILRSRMIYRWDDMKQYLEDNFGFFTRIKLSENQEEELEDLFEKTFEQRNSADQKTLYASFNEFAVAVFRIFNDAAGLAFNTTGHSGNPVPVFAIGVGSERLSGVQNNIDIPKAILEAVK